MFRFTWKQITQGGLKSTGGVIPKSSHCKLNIRCHSVYQGCSNFFPEDPNFSIKILRDLKQKTFILPKLVRGVILSSFTEFPEVWVILDMRTAGSHFYDFYHNVVYEFWGRVFNKIWNSKTLDFDRRMVSLRFVYMISCLFLLFGVTERPATQT